MSESLGRAVLELEADGSRLDRDLSTAESRVKGHVGRIGGGIASAIGAGTRKAGLALGLLGGVAGGIAAKMGLDFYNVQQQAQIAFTTMLGDGKKAKAFLDELAAFAAKTPFEFAGLVQSSQKLLAMGFTADEIIPKMTAIGDAVAGLGGDAGTLDRVTTALGQMLAKGKVSAEEMMQLTEAGIPAWDILAKKLGVDIPKAMDMVTKKQVDARKAVDALAAGMEDRFGGMMDKQSHSLLGLWSTFKDTISQISSSVLGPFFDMATAGFEHLNDTLGSKGFQKGARHVASVVGHVMGVIIHQIGAAVGFVRAHWPQISAVFNAVKNFIVNTVMPAFGRLRRWVSQVVKDVGAVLEKHKPELTSIWDDVKSIVSTVVTIFREDVGPLLRRVLPRAIDIAIPVIKLLADTLAGAANAAYTLVSAIKSVIGWIDRLPGGGQGLLGYIHDAGHALHLPSYKAAGGPVSAGMPYIVGERGPELFVPRLSGSIVPNGAGGGVTLVFPRYAGNRRELISEVKAGLDEWRRSTGRDAF